MRKLLLAIEKLNYLKNGLFVRFSVEYFRVTLDRFEPHFTKNGAAERNPERLSVRKRARIKRENMNVGKSSKINVGGTFDQLIMLSERQSMNITICMFVLNHHKILWQ